MCPVFKIVDACLFVSQLSEICHVDHSLGVLFETSRITAIYRAWTSPEKEDVMSSTSSSISIEGIGITDNNRLTISTTNSKHRFSCQTLFENRTLTVQYRKTHHLSNHQVVLLLFYHVRIGFSIIIARAKWTRLNVLHGLFTKLYCKSNCMCNMYCNICVQRNYVAVQINSACSTLLLHLVKASWRSG